MSIAKIQKGDQVKVISGNYRGTVGLVSQVVKKRLAKGGVRTRVAVSEIPQIVDYRRNLKMYNVPGEMRTKDRLIDISNVQLVTDKGEVSRVRVDFKDGKKVRILKKTNKAVTKNELTTESTSTKNKKTESKSKEKTAETKTKKTTSKKTTKEQK